MISIRSLEKTGFKDIHDAFVRAFSDYVEPFKLSLPQLKHMIERRGCNLALSFGAFSGEVLVGFILNGIGDWCGKLTAYDTGTGTVKEFRKQGIAQRLFNESLEKLKKQGVTQYLLEVIRTNKAAHELYTKAGFTVSREFDYYISSKERLRIQPKSLKEQFLLKEISNPDWNVFRSFWDFEPSWQNSIPSIIRKKSSFTVTGIFKKTKMVGYGIVERETGDIPQLGIAPESRRRGLATLMIKHLAGLSETNEIKIINTDASYEPFKKFAESIHLEPGFGQYEMTKEF